MTSTTLDRSRLLGYAALGLGLAACGVQGPPVEDPLAAVTQLGSGASALQVDPATGLGFLAEPGQGGLSRSPRLVSLSWGRLVDVYALGAARGERVPVLRDFVVGPEIDSDGVDFELDASLAGAGWRLTVLHPPGTSAFADALARLEAGLVPLAPRAPGTAALSPLDAVPRNAALVLAFDDLLAAGVVDEHTIQVASGDPPLRPQRARVLADPSHGALVAGRFHSSRAIVVPALPGEATRLALRIPTLAAPAAGKAALLTNRAGRSLSDAGNAPLDLAAPTRDVVRVLEISTGLLADDRPPFVVGKQAGQLTAVQPTANPLLFLVDFQFATTSCAVSLQVGETLETAAHQAEVLAPSAPPVGGQVTKVRVRLSSGDPATFAPAAAVSSTRWDPSLGARAECYVRFSPQARVLPALGVSSQASVVLSFSEPMDPASVQALQSFRVAYEVPPDPSPLFSHVVGAITSSPTLEEHRFVPALPLRHASGTAERYRVELSGVTDLAGNALAFDLPQTTFVLDRTEPSQASSGFALTFSSPDEDGDGKVELRGGLLYDLSQGVVTGRPVTRFASVLDGSQPLVAVMPSLGAPIQTPLSQYGSKLMAVWRYVDMGFPLLDPLLHDLDVEGLHWAPFGAVQLDQFSEFRMALAHSRYLPDEAVSSGLLPNFRFSGLVTTFDSNLLSPVEDPLTVVHDKAKGYLIDPLDTFVSSTGTTLQPWPLNRNVPPGQFEYWTWRDTSKLSLGGATGNGAGPGADPQRLMQVTGTGLVGFYPTGDIPTIGLPLLTEFRCYPDAGALGLNGLKVSFALNSSYKPTFRAFSTGGTFGGSTTLVDPDNEPVAQGGINPNTGQQTVPFDNTFHVGQADFVLRVTRGHTRWFDTGGTSQFAAAVIEPGPGALPAGTQAVVAFRGASAITSSGPQPWVDALNLDPYGDSFSIAQLGMLGLSSLNGFVVQYFPVATDETWKADLSEIDGARYVQARITLISNPETNLVARLSGLGVAFLE